MSASCPIRSWEFRVVDGADGHGSWAPIDVPGCWEDAGVPKDHAGPVDYRATVAVPEFGPGERVCVRFGAVSYACIVAVDGVEVGRHVGMWDGFEVDVTDAVRPGCTSELTVRVEKPASLTAGPDSEPAAGSYPTRQTLAGFLPYVWGHVHGGIWQDVELVVRRGTLLRDVTTWGRPDGTLAAQATVSAPAQVRLTVTDQDGTVVAETDGWVDDVATLRAVVPTPRSWSPVSPYLYTVTLSVKGGETVTRRVGLREIAADGSRLTLNGEPLYPRMLLSWGWYPDNLFCNPGPDRVRADFAQLKRLGFNGVKLCLWFPPAYYFDIADEMGILLWVELPMWLPHPTEHFLDQLGTEVDRLVQASRDHTSVILYTLGCELSSVIGDDVLGPLYGRVKTLGRDALVRDNSGSGEAYGGLLTEYADFYDHHLYCEPQYFRETLEHFAPRWRTEKPWLFGEFCDLDTFRDLRRFGDDRGRWPWWTSDDPAVNPQGARWQYDVQDHERRLRANGFWDRGAELEAISRRQAVLHRKVTLETVRSRHDTSGYVITGERDTPISTAGLWDDFGQLKVDPREFASFNSDLVLTLGWDRRRAWVAGGDRPAFFDPWCHESGAVVRPHVLLAHHGRTSDRAYVTWSVEVEGGEELANGVQDGPYVQAGRVTELTIAEFELPVVTHPRTLTLRARVRVGDETTENSWRFWCFPSDSWSGIGSLAVHDPAGRLADLSRVIGDVRVVEPDSAEESGVGEGVVVATRWSARVRDHLRAGGNAVLLVDEQSGSPFPVASMPFWREAVKVFEPHQAWGEFPHEGWADLQCAAFAPDLALDTSEAREEITPILRRVDARTAEVHDYAVEVAYGNGRLIVSTLRLEGSRGDQPRGLSRSPAASYLLSAWVRALG